MSHHHHHPHHTEHPQRKKPFHRSWIVIVGAILMLIAILVYVFTLDESHVPGQPVIPSVAVPAK